MCCTGFTMPSQDVYNYVTNKWKEQGMSIVVENDFEKDIRHLDLVPYKSQ